MKKILILFALFINAFAYAQNSKNEIAFITAINPDAKIFTIDADFVQMLTGKAAIIAAKKEGEAEYDINKKKDTVWYVPNDYYILNSNKKIRKLPLSPSVNILLVKDGGSKVIKSMLPALRKKYQGKIFKLIIEESTVVRIEEVYVP